MHIIPVASGKGGVGKSLVSANLAIALAQAGKRVVLADLDLGGSNLHLILGVPAGGASLGSFLSDKAADFRSVIQTTDTPNLSFIPGDAEIPGLANLHAAQKRMLTRRLGALEADFLVLDLGAGTGRNMLDFFLLSGQGIVVTTPTPTATVNAYLFLKNVIFRILHNTVGRKGPGAEFLHTLMHDKARLKSVYLPDIVRELRNHAPKAAAEYEQRIRRFRPRVIVNMIEDPRDAEKVNRLRHSTQQYLGIDLLHLGIVYRDDLQNTALSARIPIVRYKPQSVLSQAIYRIAEKVVQLSSEEDARPLDLEAIDDSFDAAEMEAEADFETKLGYIEELLHSGALSQGDLVETIKSQHFEITQLKKQNNLYKSKLVRAMQAGFRG